MSYSSKDIKKKIRGILIFNGMRLYFFHFKPDHF